MPTEGPAQDASEAVLDDLAQLTAQVQDVLGDVWQRPVEDGPLLGSMADGVWQATAAFQQSLLEHPTRLLQAQVSLWEAYWAIWQRGLQVAGGDPATEGDRSIGDRRFRAADWRLPAFDMIRQCYLVTSNWLLAQVADTQDLEPQARRRLAFYTRQFADALSPSNFLATNPEVLRATAESGGQNLLQGLRYLLDDLQRGDGRLTPRMVDPQAFTVGVDLAATPGKVVFENALMQLIQYSPLTEQVYRRPLLVVPPWINKFYVMDLQPNNSLVRWWVEQGYTVFMISWINPGPQLADKSFDDYMLEGPLAALDAIEQACGEREVNAVGYCIGGTLLMSTLAYLAAKQDTRIQSATTFASLLDFTDPGDLGVFIDEDQVAAVEARMADTGYLDSADMAAAFNLLRANDLIWSFFVNNYLLGKEPAAFDLLFWNADATRMPAAMHSFYLRNMYLHNRLREPGGITLAGVPIDLGKITVPCYFVATAEDHIAPWRSVYAGARLPGGKTRFVLAGSGHIAGIINPPAARKYQFWTADTLPDTPDAWREAAIERAGSWWPDWKFWLGRRAGGKVTARQPGEGGLPAIEDAPGRYVRMSSREE
jgi:polyhydroxyalkanoate synthase